MQYTFIDLFAGIGGFHLAFHDVGAKCVFACEWDEHARKTYETNWRKVSPEMFEKGNFAGDIKFVNEKEMPDFDIITGGFPCQPFSHAGFKKGFADQRGTLFHDIVRIMKEKKPAAFFLENVSHLLKHDDGKTFEVIKKTIEEELGYSFYHKIVRASDFGLPQHRPRLFMVGFRDKNINFEFPEPIKLTKTMSDIWKGKCEKRIGYTLRVGGRGSGIHDRRNWDSYMVDGEVKKLSPTEGKRMMGFPEDFIFPVSQVQAMKQLGNSVAVNGIKAVAQQIINSLEIYDNRKQGRVERVLRVPENSRGRETIRSR
ncbi:MAG TPA: DNA cytosine methyltransferase [Candidatus Gracilibacteria bacterium]|nr:DNA cytosine methyltransferase [Candidatus Gracilibacteria bacterium]